MKVNKILVFIMMLVSFVFVTSCVQSTMTYRVTLNLEDGTVHDIIRFKQGESVQLEDITKEGYTFLGWYTNEDELIEDGYQFTSSIVLTAKFKINQYTYKFIVDEEVIKEETLDYGSEIVYPENPTKEATAEFSYEFIGWGKEDTVLTDNIEFVAEFKEVKNQYTYKFIVDEEVIKEETLDFGSEIVYPENPEKEGFVFIGWDNLETVLNKDEVFNAVFELDAPKYTYVFKNDDGEVIKEETAFEGAEIVYPENPEKEATKEFKYEFIGWDKEDTVLTGDVVFTAVYKEIKQQYTYKFIVDGVVVKEETLDYGLEIVYPENPEKEATQEFSYEFIGWDKADTVLTDNVDFVAEFKEIKNQYTYRFEDFDGTLLYEETVDYGTMPTEPSEPVREGYTFIGWDKEIEEVVDDVVYTAMYEEIVEFTLEGKTISILGDSISTFYAEGSEMNSYYGGENQFYYPLYSATVKTVDLTWWYQLIENTSLKLGINNSWSGSCAYGTGSSAGQNDGRINTIVENGNPDIVIIYLGTNDCASGFSVSEFSSAIETMITKINNICDAQIFLTTLGYSAYTGMQYSDVTRKDYNNALRTIAAEQNCGIVPLDEYIVEDNYMIYLGDYLHYNAKGAKLLSKIYEKAIKEYFDIAFDEEIEVEHKEVLPEGILGKVTATANSGFWGGYESNVYLFEASSATIAQFSQRYELTLNPDNNKYYVTGIYKTGESVPVHDCDYVVIISEKHSEFTAILGDLANVVIGSIAEFDPNSNFPVEITFKTGDGNAPSGDKDPIDPDPIDPVEGALHVGAYNTGVWTVYSTTVMCYEASKVGSTSTYENFYLIKLNKGANDGEYVVSAKKDVGVTEDYAPCDLYIFIYRDLAVKTFYDACSVGQTVTVTGDITSGDAYLTFN